MSKRVYLISCSGRPNYGDELITASWLVYLYNYHPDYEVWLDTPEPGNAIALFQRYHPNFKPINTLWKICWRVQQDVTKDHDSVTNLISNFGSPDIDLNIEIFLSSDIVHVLGGGYINANWKENYSILIACAALKKLSSVKTYATGLSFYPHEDFVDSETFSSAIASFDHFSVRDAVTAARFNVSNEQDDAFLGYHLGLIATRDDENMPDIVCCIQSELAEDEQFSGWVNGVGKYLKQQRKEGRRIAYCEAIPGADNLAYKALLQVVPDLEFYPFSTLWRNGMPLAAGSQIISTRFHHHLVGACLGIKGTALSIDRQYYANKHGSLFTLGTGWELQQHGENAENIKPTLNADFQAKAQYIARKKFQCANKFYQNS
ncbi:polysaccharide pyruvyl transferase family protein [Serratia liquefaciens]|uniref:polysaccharide pyruvyl transferase family protein n=1 Tax=Serratia liquefaciens TaxID=614 RepID=UPI00217C4256|nr:polysaccharide pyruvyl transferase family protein [Serratia liquefaciens]CAI0813200.1 Polysaccharide pyruvyl transferase [Serratia liquefaciens]